MAGQIETAAQAWLERNPVARKRLESGQIADHCHEHSHTTSSDRGDLTNRLYAVKANGKPGEELEYHPVGTPHFHRHQHNIEGWANTNFAAHTNGGVINGNVVVRRWLPGGEKPEAYRRLSSRRRRYWIFQANPDSFALAEELAARSPDLGWWQVNQHQNEVGSGDMVFLWQAGKQAGIYGLATVTSLPKVTPDSSPKLAVDLEVNAVYIDRPLLKRELLGVPGLRSLALLRSFPRNMGTNFPVTADEASTLTRMLAIVEPPTQYYRPPAGASTTSRRSKGSTLPLAEDGYYYETSARLVAITPRHNRLSNKFADWLANNGYSDVIKEKSCVDVEFNDGGSLCRAELKVCDLGTRFAIREALGQLLEYNFFGSRQPADQWFIILDRPASSEDEQYVERLRTHLKLPLHLRWQELDGFVSSATPRPIP